jgi:predicted  nucleic acid-binding Zn-ribbon protein
MARIATLRQRNTRLASSIAYYDSRAAKQSEQLTRLNKSNDLENGTMDEAEAEEMYTEDDVKRVEEEIKELERKKQSLEDRVSSMEKDLNFR